MRRRIIMELMCSSPVDFGAINAAYGIDFRSYFAGELELLKPYEAAGLIGIDADGIKVTPTGRLFVRAVGMVFDKHLAQPTTAAYSKLI